MKGWAIAISSDLVAILLVAAAVLLILAMTGMLLATRAQRRRDRQSKKEIPESLIDVSIVHSATEGRHLVDRLSELQGRLAAMAEEIGQLRAPVSRIDELRAENLRLSQECEAFLVERDQLRAILARIGELIQRASEVRPPATAETSPEVEP
jgi:septal ring factor EnvC (AmiA/AmiB activator)